MHSGLKFAALTAFAAAFGWATAASAQTISISTLPPGSINNVQTQAIAGVVQNETGLQMRIVTFNSPAANMGAVQEGEAEFSFMSNDEVGAAIRGTQEFEGHEMPDLRLVTTVFPFKVGVVVRADSDIHEVADLAGKRFPIGWQGFPQGIPLSEAMLATAGLSLDDTDGVMTTNLLRAADDLGAGRLDATIFAIGAPKMAELDASIGIRFLGFDDSEEAREAMASVRPEYHIASQAPLPHLHGVHEEMNLMEYAMTVIAHADVDEDTVYQVAKAIHENKEGLVAAHPSFNAMNPDNLAVCQPDVSYHPGAIRFYQEIGIWDCD
jgi:uncharacterized protein